MEASDEFWCFTRITEQNKNIFQMIELSLILKFYPCKQLISNIDNLCLQKVNTRKWLGIEENMPMVIGSLFQIISDCISLERRKS